MGWHYGTAAEFQIVVFDILDIEEVGQLGSSIYWAMSRSSGTGLHLWLKAGKKNDLVDSNVAVRGGGFW